MHSDVPPTVRPKRNLPLVGIVIGSLLTLSPLAGLLGTVVAMIGAFNVLASSGISDEHALAESVGHALYSTSIGIFLCPIGMVVLTVSIILHGRRKPLTPPPLP